GINQSKTKHSEGISLYITILYGGVHNKAIILYWTSRIHIVYIRIVLVIDAEGNTAYEILEAEYRDNLTMDEALLLGMKCMTKVLEGKAEPQKIRVAIIPRETGKFQKLPVEEVDKYLRKLDAGKKAPAGK